VTSDEIFLTGGTGFVGSHVLSALLASGYRVRALTRPGSRALPDHPDVTAVTGDLAQPGSLVPALSGCRYLVHVAAVYSFAPAARSEMRRINVVGTAGLLEAAREAGVERAVVTSSSATVGPMRGSRPARETDLAGDHASAYHGSKIEEERAVAAARLPTVLVLPTAPVGPGDWRPTPTGKMVVDFMRGRMFASLGGGLNLVPAEDVGKAHVLALQRGRPGERYLIGAENLPIAGIWSRLAAICGRRPPRWEIPQSLALALGLADEFRCRLVERSRRNAMPLVPLEGVRMARERMYVSCEKAERELGYRPGDVNQALERAVAWYRTHGYA